MRVTLKHAINLPVACAIALTALVPSTANAVATGPTQYAVESCYPDKWEGQGFASYNDCGAWYWDQYCRSNYANPQCQLGENPFR